MDIQARPRQGLKVSSEGNVNTPEERLFQGLTTLTWKENCPISASTLDLGSANGNLFRFEGQQTDKRFPESTLVKLQSSLNVPIRLSRCASSEGV